MKAVVQMRVGTTDEWKDENPILYEAEIAIEVTAKKNDKGIPIRLLKIGDGVHPWNLLEYVTKDNIKDLPEYMENSLGQLSSLLQQESERAIRAENMLDSAVKKETQRALSAEEILNKSIQDESGRAKESETSLNTAIQAEKKRAAEAEINLSESIQEETNRATKQENVILEGIKSEEARAKAVEHTLDGRVTSVQTEAKQYTDTSVQAEKNRALGVEDTLDDRITSVQTEAKQYTDTSVQAEKDRATGAENTLNNKIDESIQSEKTRAETAENTKIDKSAAGTEKKLVQSVSVKETRKETIVLLVKSTNVETGVSTEFEVVLPVTSTTQAGVMPFESFKQIDTNTKRIDALERVSIIYAIDLGTESPTQAELQAVYEAASGETGEPLDQTTLEDTGTQKKYTWFQTSGEWVDMGYSAIGLAEAEKPGLVAGSEDVGKVFVENDGSMSLNGYSDLVSGIANAQNTADSKQNKLSRTIVGNDNATASVTDTGGNLSIAQPVTVATPASSATQITAGTRSLRATIKIIIDNIAHLFASKQNNLSRTVTGNDNATGTVTDTGGNLSIPTPVTITAPAASTTQATAGTKSLRSLVQIIVNNVASLFSTKQNNLNRTVTGNDNATGTVSDTGGNLSIPQPVTVIAPAASSTQITAGTRTLRATIKILIDNIASLFSTKQNNLNRTLIGNDNATASVTDTGGNLSIAQPVTVADPVSSATQITAGTRSLRATIKIIVDNIASLFSTKQNNLNRTVVGNDNATASVTDTGGTLNVAIPVVVADPSASTTQATAGTKTLRSIIQIIVNNIADYFVHKSATSAHNATSTATASRIMMRDSAGRAKVAAPSAVDDIANKAYVDSNVLKKRYVHNLEINANSGNYLTSSGMALRAYVTVFSTSNTPITTTTQLVQYLNSIGAVYDGTGGGKYYVASGAGKNFNNTNQIITIRGIAVSNKDTNILQILTNYTRISGSGSDFNLTSTSHDITATYTSVTVKDNLIIDLTV